MKKKIICSDTTVSCVHWLKKLLEIVHGDCELECYTLSAKTFEINEQVDDRICVVIKGWFTTKPKKRFAFEASMQVCSSPEGATLNTNWAHHLLIVNDDQMKCYACWHIGNGILKIADSSVRSSAWLVGTGAENRWSEPYFDHISEGLCFSI